MNGQSLYVIDHPQGFVKIGTSYDPHGRLSNMQVGSPYELSLRWTVKTKYATPVERKFHAEFSELNVRGEWFEDPDATLDEMIEQLKEVERYLVTEIVSYSHGGDVDCMWSRFL